MERSYFFIHRWLIGSTFQVQKMDRIPRMSDRSAVESPGPQIANLLGPRCGPFCSFNMMAMEFRLEIILNQLVLKAKWAGRVRFGPAFYQKGFVGFRSFQCPNGPSGTVYISDGCQPIVSPIASARTLGI